MGSKFRKSLSPLRGKRLRDSNPLHRHEETMNDLLENMYDNALDVSQEGSFDAVCLSGIREEVVNNSNPFAPHKINGKHEIIFRGFTPYFETASDPAGEEDPEKILKKILEHRQQGFIALSADGTADFPSFGETIRVEPLEGSMSRGDARKFTYSRVDDSRRRILGKYSKLKSTRGVDAARNSFNNSNVIRLGGTAPSSATDADGSDQIPGSILPVEDPFKTRINSAFGMRTNSRTGEEEMHSGVDYNHIASMGGRTGSGKEEKGMALVSIFRGEVVEAGPNGLRHHHTASINREVAETGYGLVVKVKYDVEYADGSTVTVQCRYGHLYDIAPGISRGSIVNQGDILGYMGNRGGSRGLHLHFEAVVGGRHIDPVYLFNWHNLTPWKHESQKNRFYNEEHPELISSRIDEY